MSYKIRYGNEPKPAREQSSRRIQNKFLWLAFSIPCILGIVLPQGRALIHQLLFPWIDDTLMMSFDSMLSGIRAGETVSAAFLEFCREVIGRAGIPV